MVAIKQFQCHTMQELAIIGKYARFFKKYPTGLHGYISKENTVDDNSGASDGTQKIVTFKSNCAKLDDFSCSAPCSDEILSMCIVSVKIRYVDKRKEVITYALLDNCSQQGLI